MKIINREHWLTEFINLLSPIFSEHGYTLPKFRVSCSLPSSRAAQGNKSQTIGECWASCASADDTVEIFISPVQEFKHVPATTAHEAIHAAVNFTHGRRCGHGKEFRKLALLCKLEGKMTSTRGGKEFDELVAPILKKLGKYPHAPLSFSKRKKQSTRMIKCACGFCGYTIRTTSKWINEAGAPICPTCDEVFNVVL